MVVRERIEFVCCAGRHRLQTQTLMLSHGKFVGSPLSWCVSCCKHRNTNSSAEGKKVKETHPHREWDRGRERHKHTIFWMTSMYLIFGSHFALFFIRFQMPFDRKLNWTHCEFRCVCSKRKVRFQFCLSVVWWWREQCEHEYQWKIIQRISQWTNKQNGEQLIWCENGWAISGMHKA